MKNSPELILHLRLHDEKGTIIQDIKKTSESFLHAWSSGIMAMFSEAHQANVNDTAGVARTLGSPANFLAVGGFLDAYAAAADVTHGIRAGRGTTAVTLANYALETPVLDGVGANQMNHAVMVIARTPGVPMDYVSLSRVLTNLSGNPINVTECGLYVQSSEGANPAVIRYYCIIRDVFTVVPVANAQTLTIEYQVQNLL